MQNTGRYIYVSFYNNYSVYIIVVNLFTPQWSGKANLFFKNKKINNLRKG